MTIIPGLAEHSDKAMLGSSGYKRRHGDLYATEPWVTRALLSRVRFRGPVWEPAAGRGDMVRVLQDAGYEVYASISPAALSAAMSTGSIS